tara:strand:+ start:6557 stop:6997 length:441 start_codon:yes stop_codon:yes gene_type:complete
VRAIGTYSHASHTMKLKKSAKASGVRMGAMIVLQHLCSRAEFDRPEVTITKPQIVRDLGIDQNTAQRGLSKLRALGVIVPIKGFEGGRGVPVTYRLVDIGDDKPEIDAPAKGLSGKISQARIRIMQEQPKLTWGEAQLLAKREIGA